MREFTKKNINIIIAIFILIQPILDLLTGICLHALNISITIGIIIRMIFLLFICLITIFIFKKKKILIPYLIIGLYFIFYIIGIITYNKTGLFQEMQGLIKTFYFPILFISLYAIKDEIRISNMTLFVTLFFYLIFIFIPLLFGIGYNTYEITKAGTLGFFNSANEISGIISLLTPIMFIIFKESKNKIAISILAIMYLVVILMVGTKTPLLSLGITIVISLIYIWTRAFQEKKYKNVILSVLVTIICLVGIIIIIPKTNFYKNIETHLNYLGLENISEVFEDEELIDHFIFSQRLTFLKKKAYLYKEATIYQKIFGIGYIKDKRPTKLIEMDYFDIYFSHGIIGFLIFFIITLYVLYKILEKSKKTSYEKTMLHTSLLLIIFLSFFTGHIITAPSVSILMIILILSLAKREKKDLLFADKNLEVGGIEKAQINLLENINYDKYNVTLILEEKNGSLLPKVNKNVKVKELKVSNNSNIYIRKLINVTRKLMFKIFYYHTFDFSCCYTTYSYSCNKLVKIASENTCLYVHSDYKYVYDTKEEFREFFSSRKVEEYKKIIFVSNEARNSFVQEYKELEEKTYVLNNFINTKEIIELSNGEIENSPPKDKKLFVFIGRLDDSSKKLKRAINLVKEIKEIELWIIGDGPDKEMYENYSKELKVEKRVQFFGKKLNPYPFMKKADYIILTSDYEGFPVTYLEAITLQKQIITTINTSDDAINMKDYAYIVSKDEKEMTKEVNRILKTNKNRKNIDLEQLQTLRVKKLEKIFND